MHRGVLRGEEGKAVRGWPRTRRWVLASLLWEGRGGEEGSQGGGEEGRAKRGRREVLWRMQTRTEIAWAPSLGSLSPPHPAGHHFLHLFPRVGLPQRRQRGLHVSGGRGHVSSPAWGPTTWRGAAWGGRRVWRLRRCSGQPSGHLLCAWPTRACAPWHVGRLTWSRGPPCGSSHTCHGAGCCDVGSADGPEPQHYP